jgi:signal transduction histidine kinase
MKLRLFLAFTLIVLISVVSVVIIARQSTTNEVRAFMFRGGMAGSEGLVAALEDYYQSHHSWLDVESLFQTPGQGRGSGGQEMGAAMGGMMNQRLRLTDGQGTLIVDTSDGYPVGELSKSDLVNAIPLNSDGQIVGYLLPEGGMGFTSNDESFLISRINRAALIAGLIAAGLSLILAFLLAYRLLQPVRELTYAADELAKGDLSQRVTVWGDDEIATLGNTFNQMADSLQNAEESRRAMTADIAHELRNPLAVQRANLEALQDGIYPLTPESLDPILEQNQLLNRLVEDLRTLALADSGQLNLERIPTDYPALVKRVAERFDPQADSKQIEIVLPADIPCPTILIDPGRVEQILGNLLSNALRHTPQHGNIWIEISCSYDSAHLALRDSGSGISQEALPYVFDRFYRVDKSRSRSEGGTGLGLAIARQLAQAHGGNLTVTNHPDGGALFTLNLPIAGD